MIEILASWTEREWEITNTGKGNKKAGRRASGMEKYITTMKTRVRSFALGEAVHVKLQAGLDVCSLVLVNVVALCKFVKHLLYFGQEFASLTNLCSGTQLTHCIAHRLGIISVVEAAACRLTNSLKSGFVVCHSLFSFFFCL